MLHGHTSVSSGRHSSSGQQEIRLNVIICLLGYVSHVKAGQLEYRLAQSANIASSGQHQLQSLLLTWRKRSAASTHPTASSLTFMMSPRLYGSLFILPARREVSSGGRAEATTHHFLLLSSGMRTCHNHQATCTGSADSIRIHPHRVEQRRFIHHTRRRPLASAAEHTDQLVGMRPVPESEHGVSHSEQS